MFRKRKIRTLIRLLQGQIKKLTLHHQNQVVRVIPHHQGQVIRVIPHLQGQVAVVILLHQDHQAQAHVLRVLRQDQVVAEGEDNLLH